MDHEKSKPLILQKRSMYGYWILNEISRGAFGVVYRAIDRKTGETVAMKQQSLHKASAAEYRILKSLPHHPRIIQFKKLIVDKSRGLVFFVMENADFDLRQQLKSMKKEKPFSQMEIKLMIKQLLEGVTFLHKNDLMHRDLKPSNILLGYEEGKEMRICDFGLSAYVGATKYDPHVGTRWYKAPELLRGSRNYSSAVDMWAVGCIMAEMVLGEALFQGESDDAQLRCIHLLINPSSNLFGAKMATAATSLSPLGMHLLRRLLAYYPEKRISAADALNHSWFKEFV